MWLSSAADGDLDVFWFDAEGDGQRLFSFRNRHPALPCHGGRPRRRHRLELQSAQLDAQVFQRAIYNGVTQLLPPDFGKRKLGVFRYLDSVARLVSPIFAAVDLCESGNSTDKEGSPLPNPFSST